MSKPNEQFIPEAQAAIRDVDPDAAPVVSAIPTLSIPGLGVERVLSAKLADGSEWQIEAGSARRLMADEIAERNRSRESFLG